MMNSESQAESPIEPMHELMVLRKRLNRIIVWHAREEFEGGLAGDYCVECGGMWPCDTRLMAEGNYADTDHDPMEVDT